MERPTSVDADTSTKNKLYNHGSRLAASENDSSMTALTANPAQAMRFRFLDRKRFETMRLTTMDTKVLHIVRDGSDRIASWPPRRESRNARPKIKCVINAA
jgi:hypothetical protein